VPVAPCAGGQQTGSCGHPDRRRRHARCAGLRSRACVRRGPRWRTDPTRRGSGGPRDRTTASPAQPGAGGVGVERRLSHLAGGPDGPPGGASRAVDYARGPVPCRWTASMTRGQDLWAGVPRLAGRYHLGFT